MNEPTTIWYLIDGEQHISGKQAAELLEVNPITVYRAIQAGKLDARKLGGTWYISKADFEAYTAPPPWPVQAEHEQRGEA